MPTSGGAAAGDLPAERARGRAPIVIEGIVRVGDQRGRELGFPTANLEVPADVEVTDGVFAGLVHRDNGDIFRAAVSVGRRETFYRIEGVRLVEAYLLDFVGNLYGERLAVHLLISIRDQVRFETVAALVAQIEADVDAVRALVVLDEMPGAPPVEPSMSSTVPPVPSLAYLTMSDRPSRIVVRRSSRRREKIAGKKEVR